MTRFLINFLFFIINKGLHYGRMWIFMNVQRSVTEAAEESFFFKFLYEIKKVAQFDFIQKERVRIIDETHLPLVQLSSSVFPNVLSASAGFGFPALCLSGAATSRDSFTQNNIA